MKSEASGRRGDLPPETDQATRSSAGTFRGFLNKASHRAPAGPHVGEVSRSAPATAQPERGSLDISAATLPSTASPKPYESPSLAALGTRDGEPSRGIDRSFVDFPPPADHPGDVRLVPGAWPEPRLEDAGLPVARRFHDPARAALVSMSHDFGHDLVTGRVRPDSVQAGALAELLETVRAYRNRPVGHAAGEGGHPAETNYIDGRGVLRDIDDETLKNLLRASGWSDAEITAFEKASSESGVFNAVLPQVFNNVSLATSSFVAAGTGHMGVAYRLIAPAVNVAFSLALAPPVVALAKMRTSPMAEDHRLRGAPQMRPDGGEINARNWPSRFARTVYDTGRQLQGAVDAFEAVVRRTLGDVPAAGALLTPAEIHQLRPAALSLQIKADESTQVKRDFLVAQAYHRYNEDGNVLQAFTRAERSSGSTLTKLVASKAKPYPGFGIPDQASPDALNPYTAPGLGLVHSALNLSVGLAAAKRDELSRRKTELKLTFAFSDRFFTEESRHAIRNGARIEEQHIDVAAVAALRTTYPEALYATVLKRIDDEIEQIQGRTGRAEAKPEDPGRLAALVSERGRMDLKDFDHPEETDHLTALLRAERQGRWSRTRDIRSMLGAAVEKRKQSGDFQTQLTQNYTQVLGGGLGSLVTNAVPSLVAAVVGSSKLSPGTIAGEAAGILVAGGINGAYYAANVNAKDHQRANKGSETVVGPVRQFADGSFLYLSDAIEGGKNLAGGLLAQAFVTQRSSHRVINDSLRNANRLLPLARQIAPLPVGDADPRDAGHEAV